MEYACGESGISFSQSEGITEMLHIAGTSRGDDRNAYLISQSGKRFIGKSLFHSVMIHARKQNFTCSYDVLQLPFGDAHLAELPDGPLVLIAAGTGMSQMHSLIEHCRAAGFAHPVHLYWGVRRPEDFYRLPHWTEWEGLPNLFLHRVVSDLCGWEGRCGLLHEAVREDFADLSSLHVYASGSPAMVYATLDALVEAGMDAHQMRADVFAYAPRD